MTEGRSVFEDPKQARYAGWLLVAALTWIALILRRALDFDGVLDIDVMNFGLAAFEFDILAHQPHPPGYPGYVVFLKLIHLIAPGLEPIDVAKWGTRLCGAAVVPACYWTCRQLLGGGEHAPIGRPLVAAAMAVFHPILWFYGADGQSHAAESLLAVLLFGGAAWVSRRPGLAPRLLLVLAFALAGSVRPTIPLLSSPLLVWVFWGRVFRDWVLAFAVGVIGVLAWYVPLVIAAGGLDLYRRATHALVTELFINNFSIFGERSEWSNIANNLIVTSYSAMIAILPFIALTWRRRLPWWRVLLLTVAANVIFYALLFTMEPGYFSAVAVVACLVPATWAKRVDIATMVRTAAFFVASFGLVWFGPAHFPLLPNVSYSFLPTYSYVVNTAGAQSAFTEVLCDASEGRPTLVLTDIMFTTDNRWLPLACPNVVVAMYLHGNVFRDDMDNWIIYTDQTQFAVPPPVPLEPGPPATFRLPAVERVLLSPWTSDEWRDELANVATCPAERLESSLGEKMAVLRWPARCFQTLQFGAHTIEFTGTSHGR